MRKLLLFFVILIFGITDYGSNTDEKTASNHRSKETASQTGSNKVNQSNNVTDKKAKFLAKLDAINYQEKHSKSGEALDLIDDNTYNQKLYDNTLNEIYGVLKTQLSEPDMHDLRAIQRQWILERDADAQKRFDEEGGGSLSRVARGEIFVQATKERCNELVNLYL